uniref:Uncharacterized protein n=1 Tax=Kalanchoe fedtschenkoi TaxID=63787 RepID=A0A7N0SZZ0_KALFE
MSSLPSSEARSPPPRSWPSRCAKMVHLGRHPQSWTYRQFLESPALVRALVVPCAPSARRSELFAPGSAPQRPSIRA